MMLLQKTRGLFHLSSSFLLYTKSPKNCKCCVLVNTGPIIYHQNKRGIQTWLKKENKKLQKLENTAKRICTKNKNVKQEIKNEEKVEKKQMLPYPDKTNFRIVSVGIVLGMISISCFMQLSIYNLKKCETPEELNKQVDKILGYLDKYFLMFHNENDLHSIWKYIVDAKFITAQFFLNENFLQAITQLGTFYFASRFLESYFGSLRFLCLFLVGSLSTYILSTLFFTNIKKLESFNSFDFVLMHPTGCMSFLCALCSLSFRNFPIWKNIPIYCSVLIVPYLFSSSFACTSLWSMRGYSKKHISNETEQERMHNMNPSDIVQKDQTNETVEEITEMCRRKQALDIIKYFLILKSCDSIIERKKKENMFGCGKLKKLKKEAKDQIDTINNNSHRIFFELSAYVTDLVGIGLASISFFLFKIIK